MFQFTHPGKGATTRAYFNISFERVSIHAPWDGCDFCTHAFVLHLRVSIHAPWEGCDLIAPLHMFFACRFNSRTLGRVRLSSTRIVARSMSFNSRTLGRVRPDLFIPDALDYEFQFTHPGKGATPELDTLLGRLQVSIHAPWEGCDDVAKLRRSDIKVSIHAPWEGCDLRACAYVCAYVCFNSRTLGRVRHRPSVGKPERRRFQFTHPGKGATH